MRGRAERAGSAAQETAEYLRGLIAARKTERRSDVVSGLLDARVDDDSLTEEEVLYTLVLILGAGLHTTASQLGNLLRCVLTERGALQHLRADPGLVGNAVEEGLRFEGSLQAEYRLVRKAAVVGGVAVTPGEAVLIVNGAANRDPDKFSDPDRFQVGRPNAREHLTFGFGIHRCLGAELARCELQLALGQVVERLGGLRLGGEPVPHGFDRWRGLRSLPLQWNTCGSR
jgi:cytochrome P450